MQLDGNGALTFGALPPSSDLSYYDYATLGTAATQANYANNRYFPRLDPVRCPQGYDPCPSTETDGLRRMSGDWSVGGSDPDMDFANRFHEDGDVDAGGPCVPYPGTKGVRSLVNWTYRYGNVASWSTQDTVQIYQWGGVGEHSKVRRGVVAFGDVTDPRTMPSSGVATYSGLAYGAYTSNGASGPSTFRGAAVAVVDFASRTVSVTIQNTVMDGTSTSVPVVLAANLSMAATGSSDANYFSGPALNGTMSGGLSGRFFGPVVAGGNGTGPIELGGAVSLSNSSTKQASVAGFIVRKQ